MASGILSLPPELCVLIMINLYCPHDLHSMVRICKYWYTIYKCNITKINLKVLRNVAPLEVEADFCLAVRAHLMIQMHHSALVGSTENTQNQQGTVDFLRDILEGRFQSLETLISHFSLGEVMRSAQFFYLAIHYYAQNVVKRLNEVEGLEIPLAAVPLSYTERQRIMRALCRHEVYVSLLPTWMCRNMYVRGIRASDCAPTFLDQFKAWEIEEIGCVNQFLQDTMAEVFEGLEDYIVSLLELKQDILLAKGETEKLRTAETGQGYWSALFKKEGVETLEGTSDWEWKCHFFASRGLRNVIASTINPHIGMVLKHVHTREMSPPMFYTMNPMRLPTTPIERPGTEELRGHTMAWSWAFGDRPPIVMAAANKQLRSCGYVLWDNERLSRYWSFQKPRIVCGVDFHVDKTFLRDYETFSPALEEKLKHIKLAPEAVADVLNTMRAHSRAEVNKHTKNTGLYSYSAMDHHAIM